MPGEALTPHPIFSSQPRPAAGDPIGVADHAAQDRCLRRLSGARVPLVLLAVSTQPGRGRLLLPLLAELGLAAELEPDRLVLLSLGPAAAEPGNERRVEARARALLAGAGPLQVTALRLCSDNLAGFDDLRDFLALETPVVRPFARDLAARLAAL